MVCQKLPYLELGFALGAILDGLLVLVSEWKWLSLSSTELGTALQAVISLSELASSLVLCLTWMHLWLGLEAMLALMLQLFLLVF
jgi:hypothetical protein